LLPRDDPGLTRVCGAGFLFHRDVRREARPQGPSAGVQVLRPIGGELEQVPCGVDVPINGQLGSRHAAFGEIAAARGVSRQRVTLAWMLAKAPVVIPIPGASRPESIVDSAQAPELALTPEELARLDA
jgi:hypothetical protein